ncbi:MAG: hypothetical protein NTY85_05860 [Actinobacteria bacterium]|jgi:hypothetical protein|nr:hypothetical protein [Actinomycetota bacterium]
MREISSLQLRIAYILTALGVVAGVASFVRTGALLIAVGTAVISLAQSGKGRFERYLPLTIAVVLFGLAIALPKGL